MDIELIISYVLRYLPPELFILVLAAYVIGWLMKKTKKVADENIPLFLYPTSLVLTILWYGIVMNQGFVMIVIVKSIVYALFITFAAVYINQFIKQQIKKKEGAK